MNEQGQILPDSQLGQTLTRLAKDAETIVETGTWNGRGSTQCLRLGLVRPTQRIWTVECNFERHAEAKAIHADEPRITCLLGTIVTGEEIKFPHNEPYSFELASEIHENNRSTLVFDQIPSVIDLLFVDGGAFSGLAEVSKLKDRSKVIVLDDVREDKNKMSYGLLCYSKTFELAEDHFDDRYGWAVFRRL